MKYLTAKQVLFIHYRLIEETGGCHGVRDIKLLESAVNRPKATFDGEELYPDIFTKAASIMHSLIKNHPFIDGNKRTAIATASIFLSFNNFKLKTSNNELEQFTIKIAENDITLLKISQWFKDYTQDGVF